MANTHVTNKISGRHPLPRPHTSVKRVFSSRYTAHSRSHSIHKERKAQHPLTNRSIPTSTSKGWMGGSGPIVTRSQSQEGPKAVKRTGSAWKAARSEGALTPAPSRMHVDDVDELSPDNQPRPKRATGESTRANEGTPSPSPLLLPQDEG